MKWTHPLGLTALCVMAASCVSYEKVTAPAAVIVPNLKVGQEADILLVDDQLITKLKLVNVTADTITGKKQGRIRKIAVTNIRAAELCYSPDKQRQHIHLLETGTHVKIKLNNGDNLEMILSAVDDLKLTGRYRGKMMEVYRSDISTILVRAPAQGKTLGLLLTVILVGGIIIGVLATSSPGPVFNGI